MFNYFKGKKINVVHKNNIIKSILYVDQYENLYTNQWYVGEDGVEVYSATFSQCNEYVKVVPGKEVLISTPTSLNIVFMRLAEYDENKNFIQLQWGPLTNGQRDFTLTDTTKYVRVSFKYTTEANLLQLYTGYTVKVKDYNVNKVPYISTYYIKPIVEPNEEVIIDYYISDWDGKDVTDNNYEDTFTVTVRIDGKDDIVINNLKAGDHSVSLGTFPNLENEEQKFSILCTDQYGRNSHELFNFFLVRDSSTFTTNEYVMTEEDLTTYNIKNTDEYEVRKTIDVNLETTTISDALTAAYDAEVVESNKYVILVADTDGSGAINTNVGNTKVKYADDYDSDAVATEAANTRIGLQQLLDEKQAEGYNKVKLLKGTYRISCTGGTGETIYIPDRLTLDMNGATFKLNQFIGSGCLMVELNNTFDSHVINGIIEGDYYTHDYENSTNGSEWVNGISIGGEAKYSSFEDITLKNITGYGSGNGIANSRDGEKGYTYLYPKGIDSFTSGDIDRETGKEIASYNRTRSGYVSTNGHENIGYVAVSRYLGYQGNPCGTWNLVVYFYDENKNFIKASDSYQYRRIAVPSNAKYLRVVILNNDNPTDLNIHYFRVPTHCSFKRVKHENCRCVGMAQSAMNNMLVEDCEFLKCGSNAAKCAYDAEDGWDQMQDVTFRRLNFHDNYQNDFLTCAGHNFMVEDMVKGKVHIWERTRGFVLRNSNCGSVSLGSSSDGVVRHGVYRINNVNCTNMTTDTNVAKGCTILGPASGIFYDSSMYSSTGGTYIGCTFNIMNGDSGYINNALNCTNCTFRLADDFDNTTNRWSMRFNSTAEHVFTDCTFYGKVQFSNNNNFSSGKFINSIIEDLWMGVNVVGDEASRIEFNNCTIGSTSTSELLRYGPHNYTEGNYTKVLFKDCDITGDFNLFAYGYSKPAYGYLEINNCTLTLPNLQTIFETNNSYLELVKDFHINIIGTELNNNVSILGNNISSYEGSTVTVNIQ